MKRKHPIQNTYIDAKGVRRFVENKIIRILLDFSPMDLNQISVMFAESQPEDYEQLMQLIGYSLSGFGDLCTKINEREPCQYRTLAAAERKKDINLL